MSAPHFHELKVKRVSPEAAGAVAITFDISANLREAFAFEPGQFLTLRATINGQDVRRNYSISSPRSRLPRQGEIEVGIRAVENGLFSNWATTAIKAGDTISVMPPDGRFVVKKQRAIHRVGFAGGSGITPILSIAATTLEEQPESKFTLVYGNRNMSTVMFNEALQDLKERFAGRFTMIHILSSQAQEVDLLQGLVNGDKVRALIATFLPVKSMDEVFICGPEPMMDAVEKSLIEAGVPANRVYSERFSAGAPAGAQVVSIDAPKTTTAQTVQLTIVVDGTEHHMTMASTDRVLDVGLDAGLDLSFSCKAGVCCTCRAKVMSGTVSMAKNYTLEPWEMEQGFVLSCQARPTSENVVVSFDER